MSFSKPLGYPLDMSLRPFGYPIHSTYYIYLESIKPLGYPIFLNPGPCWRSDNEPSWRSDNFRKTLLFTLFTIFTKFYINLFTIKKLLFKGHVSKLPTNLVLRV